jgi:hypothetical protein
MNSFVASWKDSVVESVCGSSSFGIRPGGSLVRCRA